MIIVDNQLPRSKGYLFVDVEVRMQAILIFVVERKYWFPFARHGVLCTSIFMYLYILLFTKV